MADQSAGIGQQAPDRRIPPPPANVSNQAAVSAAKGERSQELTLQHCHCPTPNDAFTDPNLHISRDIRPTPPSVDQKDQKLAYSSGNSTHSANSNWRAEGGGAVTSCLTSALFWPSANCLAWRRGVALPALRVCVCVDAQCNRFLLLGWLLMSLRGFLIRQPRVGGVLQKRFKVLRRERDTKSATVNPTASRQRGDPRHPRHQHARGLTGGVVNVDDEQSARLEAPAQ